MLIFLSIISLVVSAFAVLLSFTAIKHAEDAHIEHGYTLDAADDLFEDHEERITRLEDRSHEHV